MIYKGQICTLKERLEFLRFNFIRFFYKGYQRFHDDIKEIHLILENCDWITIKRKHIGEFVLQDFERQICRQGMNRIGELKFANKFLIEIYKDANTKVESPFGKYNVFDRLTEWADITGVEIVFKTGESEYYYVDYDSKEESFGAELGEENILQKYKFNDSGDLYLSIGKFENIDDEFDGEIQNSEEARNYKWNMYELEE